MAFIKNKATVDTIKNIKIIIYSYYTVEWARYNQTEFYKILARLMPREIHADVNAGFTLVECLRELDERRAKHEEC